MGIESINTMTKPISSAEQMQQFLEQGVGDETLGSRTLGTLTKGKLFEAPSAGFGQKYAAENMPILKDMDFISRGVYNTIAPYGEKAFDIIDTIFRLPGAAAADIAQVAGVKEDDVNEIQALINVGVGLKLPEASPVMTSVAASKAVKDISKAVNVVKAEAKWVPDYIKGEAVPPFLPQPKAKSLSAAVPEKKLNPKEIKIIEERIIKPEYEGIRPTIEEGLKTRKMLGLKEGMGYKRKLGGGFELAPGQEIPAKIGKYIIERYKELGILPKDFVLKGKRPRDIINPQEGFLMTKGSEKKILRKSPYKDHSEASRKAMATRYKNMRRELDQYKEGEVVPGTIVDKYRKPFSFEKIIQNLPESNKKVRIKQLYDDIRETNPKGTLHADHFKEVQLGGVDNPLNIVATTETAHRGRLFEKGNFMNKSTLVKKINKNNKQIFDEWNSNPSSREAIKNRTHPLVKKKDELYNSQIDIEGGTGHLFDASLPGTHIKKGDAVVFKPDKIDPELKQILEVNNSYYGAGKNKFGKFDNAEDHLIDQLEKLKFSLDEMISTNFQGDVAAYKRYISKLQKTETGRAIKGAMPMAGGGMININQLIRPL